MTIRTESRIDNEILETLEHDRERLDRFATTPNARLLTALTASKSASHGLLSISTVKALAVAGFVTVGAAALYYGGSAPTVIAPPRPAGSVTIEPNPAVTSPKITVNGRNDVTTNRHVPYSAKHALPETQTAQSVLPAIIASTPAATMKEKSISIDRWSSDTPQVIRFPNKLEVVTKTR